MHGKSRESVGIKTTPIWLSFGQRALTQRLELCLSSNHRAHRQRSAEREILYN